MANTKRRALLFGLNYAHLPRYELRGCINDVVAMSAYLRGRVPGVQVEMHTDDTPDGRTECSRMGILAALTRAALDSWTDGLEWLWIHFSGHGTFIKDRSGDEGDGRDECLVPTDFETAGMLVDDDLVSIFRRFHPRTRVMAVFDSCNSGTVGDVRWSWTTEGRPQAVENRRCQTRARIVTLSGCLDPQTSADAYINGRYAGAMTTCLLEALRDTDDLFSVYRSVTQKLRERGFEQVPLLCSTYSLRAGQDRFLNDDDAHEKM